MPLSADAAVRVAGNYVRRRTVPRNDFAGTPTIASSYAAPLPLAPLGAREPDTAYLDSPTRTIVAKTCAQSQAACVRNSAWSVMSKLGWRVGHARLTLFQWHRAFRRREQGSLFWGTSYGLAGLVDTVRRTSNGYDTRTDSLF